MGLQEETDGQASEGVCLFWGLNPDGFYIRIVKGEAFEAHKAIVWSKDICREDGGLYEKAGTVLDAYDRNIAHLFRVRQGCGFTVERGRRRTFDADSGGICHAGGAF
jgi:hypothetical protein